MTSKQLGGMWMRFWFLLSGLWFAFCAYFAATVPESNPDIWSVRVEVFAVGSLGFVLWIVARFIRHGINMEQWQREMRKVHFKRWLERTLRLTLYYYAALTITAILYGITYVVFERPAPRQPGTRVCSDKGMRIVLNIEEEDIERIARSLDNQYAYTLARNLEDSGYKRLAELFRGFLKRGPGQAESPSKDQPVRQKHGR